MRSIGIAVQKNFLRFTVLEGTKSSPVLIKKERLTTVSPDEVPALMDWYETQFNRLIAEFKPDSIGYRISLDPNLEQQHTLSFPFAILNLIANRSRIPISEFSTSGITPNKLGLAKGADLHALVDSKLGQHPPYWDSLQKDSVLVAWFCL